MSFLDNLFGGGAARRDLSSAQQDAAGLRNAGAARADDLLQDSTQQQLSALGLGNTQAVRGINAGSGQARTDIARGANQARGDVNAGYGRAIGAENDFLQRTNNILDPFIERGLNSGYLDAIGANGQAAQQGYFDSYTAADPFRAYNDEVANAALVQAANASGRKFSGATDLALSRAQLERGSQDFNTSIDRLKGLYDTAVNFSNQQAGYTNATGQRVAGYEAGRGQDQAQIAQNRGTALASVAQNRGQQIAGQANTNAQSRAGVYGNTAGQRADLAYGNAQLAANDRISVGNYNAQSRGQGANNLMKIAALGLSAATPGSAGLSAAGNIMANMPKFGAS